MIRLIRSSLLAAGSFAAILLAGCAATITTRDATSALIGRPDFNAAATAAPAWTAAALQQITEYERQLAAAHVR